MIEEGFVAGAKIVQPRFSIRSFNKSIARTFAITGEPYVTLPAIARQGALLDISELPLLLRRYQLYHAPLFNISWKDLGLDKMVAGIEVTVMFLRKIARSTRNTCQK